MAKAPVPGTVKTRLCPPLSHREAADLAAAFLIDVWNAARAVRNAQVFLSFSGDRDAFPEHLRKARSFHQEGDDLGAKIEHTAQLGLFHSEAVMVIGSDLPGLSTGGLQAARNALEDHDAVLGPSIDGGFYLIGLRQCPQGILDDLPWSASNTFAATHERLVSRGLRVAQGTRFDDVDTIHDLMTLRNGIIAGSLLAPATAQALSQLSCI